MLTNVGGVSLLSGSSAATADTVSSGTLRLAADQRLARTAVLTVATGATFDLASHAQTIGALTGTGAVTLGSGALTVDQASTTSFAGSIVGAGSLTKTGSGSLNLTGVSTYAGPTTINGGRLAVNGSITSPVAVNAGGILGGNGSVGSVTIGSGGTYAPGNSIGAQTVNGNVTFAPGAIYEVQTDAAGNADRINATGTATLNGGTVEVLAAAGTYARQTNYTILTAAGGVTGKFATVTSNMTFLSPLLTYGADTVSLTLARNDLAFGAIATNQRELAVANAVAARGVGDTIYNTVLFEGSGDAQRTFSQLSGEIHASLPSELADAGRRVRGAILDHLTPDEGLGIWGQGLQSYAASRPQAGLDRIQSNRTGGLGGVDYAQNGITLGLNAGYLDDEVRISAAASHAHVKMSFLGATAGIVRDGVFLRVGGTFAWQQVDTSRVITAPGLATTLYASPRANSAELFGEAGYDLTSGPVKLTPFLGNAYNWTRIRAFTETGGIAALHVDRDSRNTDFLSAGVRLTGSTPVSGKVVLLPRVTVSYQHGFGDLNGSSVAELGGTGPSFAITGVRLGRNSLNTETGFDLQIGSRLTVGGSGFASTSREWSDYGAKASIGFRF